MLKVGLTGGLGSGKSTASRFFKSLGAFILDADNTAKKLIENDEKVKKELIKEFGTDIMDASSNVDKKKLARVAFQDEDHQQRLNYVVHPYIHNAIDKSFDKTLDQNNSELFIVDAALIYESGYDAHLDYVIVVTAQLKHRMERAMNRNTLTREEILKRIEFQWSEEEKIGLADFVIHNDGTENELGDQIVELYKKLV
jgi:dephospho-CoA kinase